MISDTTERERESRNVEFNRDNDNNFERSNLSIENCRTNLFWLLMSVVRSRFRGPSCLFRGNVESYKYRKANPGIRSNRSSIFMGWLTNSSFHFIIDYRARFDECCECVTVFSLIVALLIPTRVIKNRYKEYFFFFRQRKRTKRVQKLFTFILRITEIIDDVSR